MFLSITITPSDWIQIAIAIITFLGIIISIVIAICTLKQNSKMIEESTRPCIVIYKDTIAVNTPREYIAIKNFGSSSAIITKLDFDKSLFKSINKGFETRLNFLQNITLAPNQKYLLPITTRDTDIDNITFSISYKSSTKQYTDTFKINLTQDYAIAFNHQNQSGYQKEPTKELITISNSLQELIKHVD